MKVVVSALLLSFAVFWFGETVSELNDLILIPLFLVFVLVVHRMANRGPVPQHGRQNHLAEVTGTNHP